MVPLEVRSSLETFIALQSMVLRVISLLHALDDDVSYWKYKECCFNLDHRNIEKF